MRVIMLFDVPVVAQRQADANENLRVLVQQVANKLDKGATIAELCKHPPKDPNRSASVTIEHLDAESPEEWTPDQIDRLLDELDRQFGG